MELLNEIKEMATDDGLATFLVYNSFECEIVEHAIGIIGFDNKEMITEYIKQIKSKGDIQAKEQIFKDGPFSLTIEEVITLPEGEKETTDDAAFLINGEMYYHGILIELG